MFEDLCFCTRMAHFYPPDALCWLTLSYNAMVTGNRGDVRASMGKGSCLLASVKPLDEHLFTCEAIGTDGSY